MRRFVLAGLVLILPLLAPVASHGEERPCLEAWALAGDPLLDVRELPAFLPWAPGDTLPESAPEEAAADVRERLVNAGWWAATVAPRLAPGVRDTSRVIVTLDVQAGEPVVIGEIGVRGNRVLATEEIRARLSLGPGRPFDANRFAADVERVLRLYSERGYPLARIYPSRFRRTEDGRLGFDLRVGEGPEAEIESVRVFGARDTDPRVVARIAGVRPGDRWNVRRVERMAGRLRREGLFRSVSEPRVVTGSLDNRLGIEIELEEAPANSFQGVLGYNRDDKGRGEVVGFVDVALRNILGTARRASFRFDRQSGASRDLAFRYREPWVLSTPVSLEFGAAQSLRDSLYSRTDVDVAISVPIRDELRGTLSGERRSTTYDVTPDSTATETASGGTLGLVADWRDERLNPSRGFLADVRVGSRVTETDVRRTRFESEGQWLLPLAGRWLASFRGGFRGVWSSDDTVPLWDQYWLGGTNTVRGYNEQQFHGEQTWWLRNELRLRSSRRSRIYGFGDVGGARFRTSLPTGGFAVTRDTLFGGGFGMALESRTGLVRTELAVARGEDFSSAKVHVALEQEF
ncbi:MAG: BamA/TamA family outer membrane protein [Gemmatimonadetes bacterium]|nr:BamA/TamA family outer membrane protein [Gemmatimonadota bacterium]